LDPRQPSLHRTELVGAGLPGLARGTERVGAGLPGPPQTPRHKMSLRVAHFRQPLRLRDYDYSQPGAYFVTTCARSGLPLFGVVDGSDVRLTAQGQIVAETWRALPEHFPSVQLDESVTMPNHFHGVVLIENVGGAGEPRPYSGKTLQRSPNLGAVVGYFKYESTKRINHVGGTPGTPVWQRGYYEHVVRDEASLQRVRQYILANPQRWSLDCENPARNGDDDFDRWLASFEQSK
jgi:putative transposase